MESDRTQTQTQSPAQPQSSAEAQAPSQPRTQRQFQPAPSFAKRVLRRRNTAGAPRAAAADRTTARNTMAARGNARRSLVLGVATLGLAAGWALPAAAGASTASGNASANHLIPNGWNFCRAVEVPVSIAPGQPAQYHIWGQLCLPPGHRVTGIQVLVSGLSFDHTYFDLQSAPGQGSYVQDADAAGIATLAIDSIGTGNSSFPPSATVTMESTAYTVHQVVQAVRAGHVTGQRVSDVTLVGFSFGSAVSEYEDSVYQDDSALILTASAHQESATADGELAGMGEQVSEVPRLAAEVPPGDYGYVTLADTSRTQLFYYMPDVTSSVVAQSIATKATLSTGSVYTLADALVPSVSAAIKVPVLLVDGREDALDCASDATNCSTAATLKAAEKPYFPNTKIDTFVVPAAGHAIDGQLTAPLAYLTMIAWAYQHAGTGLHGGPAA